MKKYIFVTGGVCSSLGKGIASASIGSLLEQRGLAVRLVKIDPYINVDAGTMSPYQHGEVYVTDDGAETDLDLGNYARFTSSPLSKDHSITTGQVYQEVIRKERKGDYLGRTVQVIPHITDEIKKRIFRVGEQEGVDVTIVEIGGTVGDIESIPFLEAARQMIHDLGKTHVLSIHLTLVPTLPGGELKTKPTQHSVKAMREIGIQPDVLLCRVSQELDFDLRKKIALFTNLHVDEVFGAVDVNETIYEIPLMYHKEGVDRIVLDKLNIEAGPADLEAWKRVMLNFSKSEGMVRVGVVGKYTEHEDSYKSIDEALFHGSLINSTRLDLVKIHSGKLEKCEDPASIFAGLDGILVPGGFGERGIDGMVAAAKYARENGLPYLGICLGMHVMVIEFARNVLGLEDADSTEFTQDCKNPVISLLEEQIDVTAYGGTMRLGKNDSRLLDSTLIREMYGKKTISERHRHRYEFSNTYRDEMEKAGLLIAALTWDESLVESVQWKSHVWGIGVQYHPEFKSMPTEPHPLFRSFIDACKKHRTGNS